MKCANRRFFGQRPACDAACTVACGERTAEEAREAKSQRDTEQPLMSKFRRSGRAFDGWAERQEARVVVGNNSLQGDSWAVERSSEQAAAAG